MAPTALNLRGRPVVYPETMSARRCAPASNISCFLWRDANPRTASEASFSSLMRSMPCLRAAELDVVDDKVRNRSLLLAHAK